MFNLKGCCTFLAKSAARRSTTSTASGSSSSSREFQRPLAFSPQAKHLEHSRRKYSNTATQIKSSDATWNFLPIRTLVLSIGSKLGIKQGDFDAWTKVRVTEFKRHAGGRALMEQYNHSFIDLLKSAFPEHTWTINQMWKVPRNYWKSTSNKRLHSEEIGVELGIAKGDYEKWYRIGTSEFLELGGGPILKRHGWSMSALLKEIFPEHTWDIDRFSNKPQNYWKSKDSLRAQVDLIGAKLGISESGLSTWYNISNKTFLESGGGSALAQYSFSLSQVLSAAYPDHTWDPNRFAKKPQHYWESIQNRRELLLKVGSELGIKEGDLESWYKVSKVDLQSHGAGSIMVKYYGSSPSALIMSTLPEYSWDISRFKTL